MSTVQSKDGTTIAFDRSGEGPPIILVGGAFQHRAIDPRTTQLAALLAERFTVFHYDRRGRGDSVDTSPYEVAREIEDIEALIDEAGGSARVFGMSSGGVLSLDAARELPAKIEKLALYEPPFVVDDSRPPVPEDYRERLTELLSADRRGDAVELCVTKVVGVPTEVVAQMRNAPIWPAFEAAAHTLVYDAAIMGDTQSGRPLPAGRWDSVKVPTLVIDGGASHEHVHSGAQALADILPDARRRTLEGQTHDVAPELLAPVLEGFFVG